MTEKLKCECGKEFIIKPELSAYEGEVVLFCNYCHNLHFNAQKEYSNETLELLNKN